MAIRKAHGNARYIYARIEIVRELKRTPGINPNIIHSMIDALSERFWCPRCDFCNTCNHIELFYDQMRRFNGGCQHKYGISVYDLYGIYDLIRLYKSTPDFSALDVRNVKALEKERHLRNKLRNAKFNNQHLFQCIACKIKHSEYNGSCTIDFGDPSIANVPFLCDDCFVNFMTFSRRNIWIKFKKHFDDLSEIELDQLITLWSISKLRKAAKAIPHKSKKK